MTPPILPLTGDFGAYMSHGVGEELKAKSYTFWPTLSHSHTILDQANLGMTLIGLKV